MATSSGPRGPLPIVVGVTGHRDLRSQDLQPLTDAVRRVLAGLQAKCPHTSLLILSPLAEGADRLVARVALDLGITIVAPLPLPKSEYKKEFTDSTSAAEFDALAARAERSFVVPAPDGASPGRPECYAYAGAYVARHCHVLLALWDGNVTGKVGGTAEIVRLRIEGVTPEFAPTRPLERPDQGIVYQIVTPRQSDGTTEGKPFEVRVLHPASCASAAGARQLLARICRSTDAFNCFALEAEGPRVAAARERSRRHLLHGASNLPDGLDALRELYACADQAAGYFQKRTRLTIRTLFWIAFGIVVSFELFAHGDDLVPELPVRIKLIAYGVLFAIGFGVQKWATSREFDARHLDYRALVEAIRVQFYWAAARVRAVVADYWLRERLEGTEWIRMALRASEVLLPYSESPANAGADGPPLRDVVDEWVKGQHDYFARAAKREERLLTRLERRISALFALSLIGVAVIFLLTFDLVPGLPESLHAPVVALIGLAGAAAALIHGYAEQRALSLHVRRYERMHALYAAGLQALKRPMAVDDGPAVRELLVELGREALEENGDWVMLHRERPIELPG